MSTRNKATLLALLLSISIAHADGIGGGIGSSEGIINRGTSTTPTYTGPLDVVASPTDFWSLRGGSAAIVTAGTQKLINARNTATSEACDILVSSSNGGLGSTANCTGSSNGKTAAAFCALSGGPCAVPTIYTQTGSGNNLTQATTSAQPTLVFSCYNSKPCLSFAAASTQSLVGSGTNNAQPFTWTMAALNSDSSGNVYMVALGNCAPGFLSYQNAGNSTFDFNAGTDTAVAGATHNILHFYQFVANGASSVGNIDGTDNSISAGTNTPGTTRVMGACTAFGYSNSQISEWGEWPIGFSSLQRPAMYSNMSTYW